jgi:hypothetical protein
VHSIDPAAKMAAKMAKRQRFDSAINLEVSEVRQLPKESRMTEKTVAQK